MDIEIKKGLVYIASIEDATNTIIVGITEQMPQTVNELISEAYNNIDEVSIILRWLKPVPNIELAKHMINHKLSKSRFSYSLFNIDTDEAIKICDDSLSSFFI